MSLRLRVELGARRSCTLPQFERLNTGHRGPDRDRGHWPYTGSGTTDRMLPAPVSFPRHRLLNQPPRSISKLLRAPARLTNCSALLLLALLTFSVLLNLRSLYYSPTYDAAFSRSIVETLPSKSPASGLDHLVIVPGHAIWTGAHLGDVENEDSWILAPYQRGRGRPSIFRAHISRG